MALPFNDPTNRNGLIQELERETGANAGDISGNTNRLKDATAAINLAKSNFLRIALQSSGTWQWDDANYTRYPIIRTNIVSGTRAYPVTTDQEGALVLDYYRIRVADSSGTYRDLLKVDSQSQDGAFSYFDTTTGTPVEYDKTANAVIFNPIPSYNYTNGIEIYINREAYQFTYGDTNRTAGIPSIFDEYLFLKAALSTSRRNTRTNYPLIKDAVDKMEGDEARGIQGTIGAYFSRRPRDERGRLGITQQNNK